MCRSIKQLRVPDQPATPAEIEAAALQFVRKVSGYRKPSRANEDAFEAAVAEIAATTHRLLERIGDGKQNASERHKAHTAHAADDQTVLIN